jgi:DNA-binding SARP family transcriptional activator
MMAMYRSGHVGRALEAFQRMRAVLREELGVEPCPQLQRLQQRILSGDPALDGGEPAVPDRGRAGQNGRAHVAMNASGYGIISR